MCLASPRKRLPLTAAFVVLCLLACQIPALALTAKEDPKEVSWHISALKVTYDKTRDLYVAEDEVIITGGNTRLEADYVEFSNKTKDANARGNVLFLSGGDTITCNAMKINLATETGSIDKGTIFVQEGNYYITADNLRKTGKFTYDAEQGAITTCNGDEPDWKITGKNIHVTIEGHGTASHTALWAKNLPVLYSPYLIFPVKTKRQSGLLIPSIGSTTRRGIEVEQPLFLALSRDTDATLYAHYMSERGLKTAGEFRYALDDQSKGMIRLDFLDDNKVDDGTTASRDYSFGTTPQRTNSDRWWFRMKGDQALPLGFKGRLDLDIVSDADYLLEFKDGFTGYDDTNDYFSEVFGRSLDEYDSTIRKNSLLLSRAWTASNLNIQGIWYDDVIARRSDATDTTLQTLPSLEFNTLKQPVGDSGFYLSLDSELRSFYRKDTTATLVNGQRADVYPRLYYPTRLGKSFFFEPYVGARGTAWHTSDFTDSYGDDGDYRTRAIYDTGASISTAVSRVFDLGTGGVEKLQHEIIPKLEYAFQPYVDQEDLPYFDDLDLLEETNRVTWSLTHVFTARTRVKGPDGTQSNSYRELAWFKFYQDYDIKNERDDETAADRPWQDFKLKYELNPFTYLSSYGDLAVNPYDGHFTEVKIGALIRDKRGDSIYTSYRYEVNDPRSWYNQLTVRMTDELVSYYALELDLEAENTIEQKVGLEYTRACWAAGLEYRQSEGDQSIAFMIRLTGIGEFGTR